MKDIKNTSDQEDKIRREFYIEYSDVDDEIPEGWNFENRTVYSNQPILQKNITGDARLIIRFMIDNNSITIMSLKQETMEDSEEYDLLHRSGDLDPNIAVQLLVNEYIPHYEQEYF